MSLMGDVYSAPHLSKKDAELVTKTLGDIEKEKGRLSTSETAEALVSRSRSKASPTHHLFEWDDRKAADGYRIERARFLIRAIYVVLKETPEMAPVRAFVTLTHEGKKGPIPVRKVLKNEDLTAALLEQAKSDAVIWAARYDRLRALAEMREVFAAVDRFTKRRSGTARTG